MTKSSRAVALLAAFLMLCTTLAACKRPEEVSSSTEEPSSVSTGESSATESELSAPESASSSGGKASDADSASSPGSTSTASKGPTTPKTTVKPDKDIHAGDKKDFKGREFFIGGFWAGSYFPKYGASETGDALLKHMEAIEKEYNCVFKFRNEAMDQCISNFTAASLSGTYYCDLFEVQLWHARTWIRAGYIAPMDNLKNMDVKLPKYTSSISELTRYDGHLYGTDFNSWYWKMPMFNFGGMFFNIDLLKRTKQANPFDLIEQGKWTWDAFRSICKNVTKDTNNDGTPDIWGNAKVCYMESLVSTGKNLITWDAKNKRWAFGYANSSVYDALQLASDMIHVDKSTAYGYGATDPHYGMSALFGKGKAAFLPADLEWISYGDADGAWILDMEDDYGFVPFPLAPQNKSGKYEATFTGNTHIWMIPKTAKNVEDAAFIFDRWTQPVAGTNSESWEKWCKDYYFRGNENSWKYYKTLLANAKTTMEADLGHLQTIPLYTTLEACVGNQSYTPAEAIALEHETFNAYLDSYVNSDLKLLKK